MFAHLVLLVALAVAVVTGCVGLEDRDSGESNAASMEAPEGTTTVEPGAIGGALAQPPARPRRVVTRSSERAHVAPHAEGVFRPPRVVFAT